MESATPEPVEAPPEEPKPSAKEWGFSASWQIDLFTSDSVGSGASASMNGLSRVEIPTNGISS